MWPPGEAVPTYVQPLTVNTSVVAKGMGWTYSTMLQQAGLHCSPSLVKMDIEGMEYVVLASMLAAVRRGRGTSSMMVGMPP